MSYFRRTADTGIITFDTVLTLAQLVGLTIPEEDLEPLTGALRDQLAAVTSLDELDLTDVDPIVEFDPRWRA